MKNLKEVIMQLSQDETLEANFETMKLEQKTRNKCKTLITEAILEDLKETFADVDGIVLARIAKGLGFGFETPVGLMPVFIETTMKGLDFGIEESAEAFEIKKAEKAAKAAESLAGKQKKMEADAIKREQKRKERAEKEAAKLAALKEKANV